MATPDKILSKPAQLTAEETAVMREHCYRGYVMLKKILFLAEPAEIVYSHHERLDGTGYPGGLEGKQIPLGARIVAVANTLDSICSDLPTGRLGLLQSLARKSNTGRDGSSTLKS
jgi:HD-GYP domain-containing protein (c-di-GMP phosphodiesterase class II)